MTSSNSNSQSAKLYYFTGTGNTLRLTTLVKETLENLGILTDFEPIPAMSDLEVTALKTISADWIGILAPVYALDIPRLMKAFLRKLPEAVRGQKAFVFINGGDWDDVGWGVFSTCEALRNKGYDVVYGDVVMMPNNWIPMMDAPQGDVAEQIRLRGEAFVAEKTTALIGGLKYEKPVNFNNYGKIGSKLVHIGFWDLGIKRLWKHFKVTKSCTGCGYCANHCPTKALTMVNDRPKWHKNCEQCLRCMNLCPTRSIEQLEFIGHGSKRKAYVEPHFRSTLKKE